MTGIQFYLLLDDFHRNIDMISINIKIGWNITIVCNFQSKPACTYLYR